MKIASKAAPVSFRGVSKSYGGKVLAVDNINLENPVPLRWSDAFFSGDNQISALGLNPLLGLKSCLSVVIPSFEPPFCVLSYSLSHSRPLSHDAGWGVYRSSLKRLSSLMAERTASIAAIELLCENPRRLKA